MSVNVKIKIDRNKLNKTIQSQATSALNQRTYDVTCPHCGAKITIHTGKSSCPLCRNEIDLSLNINFKD